MDVDEWLRTYGLNVENSRLDDIRAALAAQTAKEALEQGSGDTEFMRLCCCQLFRAGLVRDVLPIWEAKSASMDAGCSIDVQFLCGAGIDNTKQFLAEQQSALASKALNRILACEKSGDFQGFSVEQYSRQIEKYYLSE